MDRAASGQLSALKKYIIIITFFFTYICLYFIIKDITSLLYLISLLHAQM